MKMLENEINDIEEKDEEDFEQGISSINSNKEILDYNPNEFQINNVIFFYNKITY